MRKLSKKLALVTALCVSSSIVMTALSGCKKKVEDTENVLEIHIVEAGYGYDWLNDAIDAFKNEAWVKEKYPNLVIPQLAHTSVDRTYGVTATIAGPSANTYDLFFGVDPYGSTPNVKDGNGNSYYEDLTSFYEMEIPGEEIAVKDKMRSDIYQYLDRPTSDGGTAIYGMPWVNPWMGLLYNKTLVDDIFGADYIMPRTTNELVSMCATIREDSKTPFIFSAKANYWLQIYQTWWAQYEGTESYDNFWNGVDDDGTQTAEIFKQQGRLESLKAIESLINRPLGNNHESCTTADYTSVQQTFMRGEAVFIATGDWMETEMGNLATSQELRALKMPVLSAFVNRCSGVKDDVALAFVVQCVDESKTYEQAKEAYATAKTSFGANSQGELSQSDYTKIKEARNLMYRLQGHQAFIPAYATGKAVAKDFLLFLASNKGIEIFMKATRGCQTAFHCNVSDETYNSFSNLQKERYDRRESFIVMPSQDSFALNYYGGLRELTRNHTFDPCFAAQNEGDRKSAEQIFEEEWKYYMDNGQANFLTLLEASGL